MSEKKNSTALVPTKKNNSLPVPVKGELKTPFSLVDKAIYLNNKKDVKAILPDVLGRVLARIWIDPEFRDAFKTNPQKTLRVPWDFSSGRNDLRISETKLR